MSRFERTQDIGILLLIGTAATWLMCAPATAAIKPDFTINTKAAEITVAVESALKKHPGLAADCLAEGKRWAEKMRQDADKERRESPVMFPEGRRWSLEREYTSRSLVGRYVSILRADYSFTGGAHPNTYVDTILWDRDARRRISIRPFFKESADNGPTMTALAKLVRAAVAAEKKAREIPLDDDPDKQFAKAIKPQLIGIGPVSLAPSTLADKSSGLTFHFSPYAVGAYAEGPYTVFVPWTDLRPYLSAEGTALFGGDRPAADDNQ